MRGALAPLAKNGIPAGVSGYGCGINVAHGTPTFSAASAGASVRMSLTTASGFHSSRKGRSVRAAAAALTSPDPAAGGGNTVYCSAATNSSPSSSTGSRQRSQLSTTTSCPRPASARASEIAGNACPASPKAATITRTDPPQPPAV